MKKLICILLALAVFFPSVAFADDSSLGGMAETVYPVKNTEVVMQKEIIDIRVIDGKSFATCRFYFKNTGDYVRQLVGFPCYDSFLYANKSETDFSPEDMVYIGELFRFRTYVNGRRVPVSRKKGMVKTEYNQGADYYPVWYTWNMSFQKGQEKKVTNTYYTDAIYQQKVQYILKTGAYWKDNIGRAVIRMNITDTNLSLIGFDEGSLTPDYCTEDGVLVWDKKDIEPDRDISVYFDNLDMLQYESYEDDQADKPDAAPEEKEYSFDAEDDFYRLENHYERSHYRSVIWWGNRIYRIFGKDQPALFHYYLGLAYYNRHLYKKALAEFDKSGFLGYCQRALTLKRLGKTEEYRAFLNKMQGLDGQYPGLALWAKSRLIDMDEE